MGFEVWLVNEGGRGMMMKAGDKFAIVCMKCRTKDFKRNILVANGQMTLTYDGDILFECLACGNMERYVIAKPKATH
jgi:RNase P subunit RPR2